MVLAPGLSFPLGLLGSFFTYRIELAAAGTEVVSLSIGHPAKVVGTPCTS